MKIHLSFKQGKDVLWWNKKIKVKRNGVIYYVYADINDKMVAEYWNGEQATDVTITTDFE